jgi:hypothetical protein
MLRRIGLFSALAATATLGLTVATVTPVAAQSTTDWVTATQVLVNRLGGVNVSGEVSCAGTYARIANGDFSFYDEQGQHTIQLQPYDKVDLFANSDNYTVKQPAGKKTTIQVTHGSSRMNPCYLQWWYNPDGTSIPTSYCPEDGTVCKWETDAFGYNRDASGPLFDYASNGKFKAGLLSVNEQSIGLLIIVYHFSSDTATESSGFDTYYVQEGSYSMTDVLIRAVNYRG